MAVRINFNIECNTDGETIRENIRKSEIYRAHRVRYGKPLSLSPVALVGGGPSTAASLDILRQWPGDIYAINDTAGYLSDKGIPSFLYSIDCSRYPYKIGPLVKGALLASRCHRRQFTQFDRQDVQTFDLAEDFAGGITGGPTGACRAPLLFLRMGYINVFLFGCDGSFGNLDMTHVSGFQKVAYDNMMFVQIDGVDYLTNASLTVQTEYLAKVLTKFPRYLTNASDGLLTAMVAHPDSWVVSAVTEDLKKKVEKKGTQYFFNEYRPAEHRVWQPAAGGQAS